MADIGHTETDALLESVERQLRREYTEAANEMRAKLDNYWERFAKKDEQWRQWVESGAKTEAQYKQWLIGQTMIGERWEEMTKTLAEDMYHTDLIARSAVIDHMSEAYAINHNFATFEIETGSAMNTSYTLYDKSTVEHLVRENPNLLPPPSEISEAADVKYFSQRLQSVTMQSVLQGESIPDMARRISQTMGNAGLAGAVRYARTAINAAESKGRDDAYHRANDMGIPIKRIWLATLDNRTRDEHRELDGQIRPLDEPFEVDGEKIMYPSDPAAPAHLVWNCRCRTNAVIENFEPDYANMNLRYDDNLEGMSYEKWKAGHKKEKEP